MRFGWKNLDDESDCMSVERGEDSIASMFIAMILRLLDHQREVQVHFHLFADRKFVLRAFTCVS